MSHTPHELAEDFPQDAEVIHALKASNAHFARLAEAYHDVNRTVHRMETLIEPATDEVFNETRRRRMALKDEIAAMIAAHRRVVA